MTYRATDLRLGNDLVERTLFFSPVLFAIAIRMARARYVLNLPVSARVLVILALAAPGLAGAWWLVRHYFSSRARPGTLTVEGEAIAVAFDDGARARIPRRDVREGWRSGGGASVFLRLSRARYLGARLPSPEDAERLLDAVGIGPADRTLRVALLSRAAAADELLGTSVTVLGGAGLLTFLAVLVGPVSSPQVRLVGAAISVALMALAWRFGRAREVVLGADGLRWAGRFIPYASITGRHEDRRHDVALTLDDGSTVTLPTGARGDTLHLQVGALRWLDTAYEVIVRRLDDARALADRVDSTGARLAALDPAAHEGVTAWRARLSSHLTDGGPLRARARLDRAVATTLNPPLREAFAAVREDALSDAHLDALVSAVTASP